MAKKSTNEKSSEMTGKGKTYDIVIAGGGYVGLCVGVAIANWAPHLKIAIVDPAPLSAIENETRASAIAAAASRMLEQLGVWQEIVADAQPINEMIVTDSKLADITRPVFLTFANEQPVENGEGEKAPFAHMVPNQTMVKALRKRAQALNIDLMHGEMVSEFNRTPAGVDVTLAKGETLQTKLLVAADGVRSKLRDMAGIKTVRWPYDQMGIVITVAHERPHEGRAEEHFLPAGPFAILPLKGNRSSLVWTESTRDAERLMAMDDFSFDLELEQRFGHKLGEISVEGERKVFPLGLTLAREFVVDRVALAGDAAHGIHPIAGQGLNLGFKDAAALAQTVVEADRLGMDIGSFSTLERYQIWRRFDTVQMGVATDVLNRLFSNDNAFLRFARSTGLSMVDRMPGLKKMFIAQAAGNSPSEPSLLRGEAL